MLSSTIRGARLAHTGSVADQPSRSPYALTQSLPISAAKLRLQPNRPLRVQGMWPNLEVLPRYLRVASTRRTVTEFGPVVL